MNALVLPDLDFKSFSTRAGERKKSTCKAIERRSSVFFFDFCFSLFFPPSSLSQKKIQPQAFLFFHLQIVRETPKLKEFKTRRELKKEEENH